MEHDALCHTRSDREYMPDALSPRERDVLRLLAEGHTNRAVGELLFISVRTVEMHRASIRRKLRLSTRAEFVRYVRSEARLDE